MKIRQSLVFLLAFALSAACGSGTPKPRDQRFGAAGQVAYVSSGTGFMHVSSSAQDGARAVNLSTGDVTGTLSGANGGAAWAVAKDCDLSAEANQTLSPDGNYTVCGIVFKKEGSANDRVAMAVVNGQGLVIQPVNGSVWRTNDPRVWISFAQFAIPNITWGTPLRLMTYVSAESTVFNNTDVVTVGFTPDSTNQWRIVQYNVKTLGTNITFGSFWKPVTTTSAAIGTSSPGAIFSSSNGAVLIELPGGITQNPAVMNTYYGAFSAGFPTGANWKPLAVLGNPPGNVDLTNDATYATPLDATWGVELSAAGNGGADNVSATIARFRLDYLAR